MTFRNYYRNKGIIPGSFVLQHISFTLGELKKLSIHKSTGPDDISVRFLKDGAAVLAHSITNIINLSISTYTVQDE